MNRAERRKKNKGTNTDATWKKTDTNAPGAQNPQKTRVERGLVRRVSQEKGRGS